MYPKQGFVKSENNLYQAASERKNIQYSIRISPQFQQIFILLKVRNTTNTNLVFLCVMK